MAGMVAAKAGTMKQQMYLLEERYDLSDHPARGVVTDRTQPAQEGARRLAVVADAISAAAVNEDDRPAFGGAEPWICVLRGCYELWWSSLKRLAIMRQAKARKWKVPRVDASRS
jgi:hypothetical protein